jgi:uncharacterized protein
MTRAALPLLLAALLAAAPAAAERSGCVRMKSAAESGDPAREFLYAQALDKGGCGFTVDRKSALEWYLKSAGKGDVEAQHALGEMYFAGDGVAADYVQAKKWYLKAAQQGDGHAQLRLAYLYAERHFQPLKPDYDEAEKWFRKAAEQNTEDAQFRLGNFYINYRHPADYKDGIPWLMKAADGGNRTAMFDLGRLQIEGSGVPKDIKAGLTWITKSAEAGMLEAQIYLAEAYADGKQVPKDEMQALKWVLRLANGPSPDTFYLDRAGDIFFEGWGKIPKNYPSARQYYEEAAARVDRHALERLAQIYKDGLGVPKDEKKAAEYGAKAKR